MPAEQIQLQSLNELISIRASIGPIFNDRVTTDTSVEADKKQFLTKESYMKAHIAQKAPYTVDVESGNSYYWCACGLSKSQPFCDGSHSGSAFTPVEYIATETKTVYFCGCKQTATQPMCDGTHSKL